MTEPSAPPGRSGPVFSAPQGRSGPVFSAPQGRSGPVTSDEARAVFARRVDAWLAEDVDAYLACWHDDMRIEMPTGVIEGAGRYRKLVTGSFAWAAPVSFDVHHLAVDGESNIVFADWTIRARRRTDDVIVEWRGLSVCELRDGRISWWREHHLSPPAPKDLA